MSTGAEATDGDVVMVAAEKGDVLVGPLEGEALVPETVVARCWVRNRGG